MKNFLFPFFALGGEYSFNPEYNNLSEEEKYYLDYVDECLQSENERINDACFHTMLLILKLSEDPDKYQPEDVNAELAKITVNLTEEEKPIINDFMIACINSLGVYSEERVQERKLKRERKN